MPYRATGLGAFGFSLNWEKVPGDEATARRIIAYLEDRRLLFGTRHSGDELYCVQSANEIRHFLTAELRLAGDLPEYASDRERRPGDLEGPRCALDRMTTTEHPAAPCTPPKPITRRVPTWRGSVRSATI